MFERGLHTCSQTDRQTYHLAASSSALDESAELEDTGNDNEPTIEYIHQFINVDFCQNIILIVGERTNAYCLNILRATKRETINYKLDLVRLNVVHSIFSILCVFLNCGSTSLLVKQVAIACLPAVGLCWLVHIAAISI